MSQTVWGLSIAGDRRSRLINALRIGQHARKKLSRVALVEEWGAASIIPIFNWGEGRQWVLSIEKILYLGLGETIGMVMEYGDTMSRSKFVREKYYLKPHLC